MARLMGKTAAETIAVMMAVLKRLTMPMRSSVTTTTPPLPSSGTAVKTSFEITV
ncbi:MAG: hypothetical protein R3D28_06770 [Geminicoccaceae bacterium]